MSQQECQSASGPERPAVERFEELEGVATGELKKSYLFGRWMELHPDLDPFAHRDAYYRAKRRARRARWRLGWFLSLELVLIVYLIPHITHHQVLISISIWGLVFLVVIAVGHGVSRFREYDSTMDCHESSVGIFLIWLNELNQALGKISTFTPLIRKDTLRQLAGDILQVLVRQKRLTESEAWRAVERKTSLHEVRNAAQRAIDAQGKASDFYLTLRAVDPDFGETLVSCWHGTQDEPQPSSP